MGECWAGADGDCGMEREGGGPIERIGGKEGRGGGLEPHYS